MHHEKEQKKFTSLSYYSASTGRGDVESGKQSILSYVILMEERKLYILVIFYPISMKFDTKMYNTYAFHRIHNYNYYSFFPPIAENLHSQIFYLT